MPALRLVTANAGPCNSVIRRDGLALNSQAMLLAQAAVGITLARRVLIGFASVGCGLLFKKRPARIAACWSHSASLRRWWAHRCTSATSWPDLDISPKLSDEDIEGEWRNGDGSCPVGNAVGFTPEDLSSFIRARRGPSGARRACMAARSLHTKPPFDAPRERRAFAVPLAPAPLRRRRSPRPTESPQDRCARAC